MTYSPGESLAALLDSLPAASRRPVPVVLADNGSTDGSVEAAAERPGVRLLRTGGNLGYGAAANAGVAVLDPAIDWIVVINPDVVLGAGRHRRADRRAHRHPARRRGRPADHHPRRRRLPLRPAPAVDRRRASGMRCSAGGGRRTRGPGSTGRTTQAPVERTAGWLSGSCLLLRRAAFDAGRRLRPGLLHVLRGCRPRRTGWARPVGRTCTARPPGRSTRAVTRRSGRPRRWPRPTTAAPTATCPGATPGPGRRRCGWCCGPGLAGRAFLSKRSAKVAGGADLPDRRV